MRTDAEMQELYQKARDVNIENVLANYNYYPNREGYYKCLFHTEKTPSAKIYKNKMKCFGCGKVASAIDVVEKMDSCNSYKAIQKLLNTDFKTNREKAEEYQQFKQQQKKQNYTYEDGLNMSRPLGKENIGYIKNYLNKRCILKTLDIADSLGLEIRHSYYLKTNHICYYFKKYNLIVRKPVDGSRKPNNWGQGRHVYFNRNNSDVWYIVEGIEDALTLIIYHNFNVVCLNSTENTGKFIKEIDSKFDINNVEFIIATDTDDAGKEALNVIYRNFTEKKVKYKLYTKFYSYAKKHNLKDINECFTYNYGK